MVNPPRRGRLGQAGKSRYGCLVGILLFAAALYYGADFGAVYLRYFQLRNEMNQAARLGRTLDDATIQLRLHARIDSLDLPAQAHRFTIRRYSRPREIRIAAAYTETVDLPFTTIAIRLHPEARAPL